MPTLLVSPKSKFNRLKGSMKADRGGVSDEQGTDRYYGRRGRGASWEAEFRELEAAIKMRHYSRKAYAAYRHWACKLQTFVGSKPLSELNNGDVKAFLSDLAVRESRIEGKILLTGQVVCGE